MELHGYISSEEREIAESISVEDLKIISEIKQMALDIKFMEMLDDED